MVPPVFSAPALCNPDRPTFCVFPSASACLASPASSFHLSERPSFILMGEAGDNGTKNAEIMNEQALPVGTIAFDIATSQRIPSLATRFRIPRGVYVATVTPFNATGAFDPVVMKQLMEKNIADGAAGFFIGGSSAECFLLTEDERKLQLAAAAELKDRTTLVAHCGAIATEAAIRLATYAKAVGFRLVAATPPFYYGFGPVEICGYYKAISEAIGEPVLVYNFPGNTGKSFDLAVPAYRELFAGPYVAGIKHTNLNVHQMERIIRVNPNLIIFNGYDEQLLPALALGAHASIGSTFNCFVKLFVKIFEAYDAGELKAALKLQVRANNIMEALVSVGLIPAVKHVLETQGFAVGPPRLPFVPLGEQHFATLAKAIEENDIAE